MSTPCHGSRLLVLAVRTAGCLIRGRRAPTAPHRARAYSLDTAALGGGALKQAAHPASKPEPLSSRLGSAQRNLSAIACSLQGQSRPLCRYDFLDLGEVEEHTIKAQACKTIRRFIVDPRLARLVADELEHDLADSRAVIFECNPGPGVLTRTLLNSGAQRIVALESDKAFLPDLQVLENSLDGQLEVVHCDFFKLDPIGQGTMRPPAMYSEKLFNNLGISEVPWTEDVPVKVVGIFSQRNERNMLWKLVYALYERLSIFRYGRVELLMFISEKEYTKLVCSPGDMKNYMALGCLWQMACDIQLLHKEPWSSFLTTSKSSAVPKSILTNDHLCLVRITPRRDLFSATLTPSNTSTLVMMIKQCLAKRKAKLADRLNSWSPGSGAKLLRQVDLPEDILTGLVYPEEYKRLFEAMEHSEEFTQSWLYEEILENTRNTGCQ
ncbi:dimethyladenosine transferase 2, mitochondrial [Amia ocellicauda]|uniref:dimethyladenosine transferase 2, mitochondrial n=1 Tax=Amia ocellicauda TaxID=2972642 RepID=UPI00346456CD